MPLAPRLVVFGLAATLACRPASAPSSSSPSSTVRAPAPWSEPALASGAVPSVYLTAWRAADNRARCAPLAPARLDPELARQSRARAATFSGGWGVAYDLPDVRGAFGVAGTGASAADRDTYDAWPEKRVLADGSRVGYGPEGGTGPNWLAYVRIPGQHCLYNVWSRRGRAHLEELLGQLRFVRVE